MAGVIYFAIFLVIVWSFKSWRLDRKNKKEREKEFAESLEKKQKGQMAFAIYKRAASSLPFDERAKALIALKAVSLLNDEQTERIIRENEDGKKIDLPFNKRELTELVREINEYIKEVQANEQEKQWKKEVDGFRKLNKAQQKELLNRFKEKGVNDDRLFELKMIYLEDTVDNDIEMTDFMIGNTKLFTTRKRKN